MADMTPEEQDQGPQQLDKPPYPNTSKIENGQAFDVSGKVLGGVDDSGQAKQATPAPAGGAFDFGFKPQPAETHAAQPTQAAEQPSGFDFGFKPAGADAGAAKGTKWESYARMGNYFHAQPMEGEENKGVAHSLHTFLSFPNALYHAFQDPATEQEKIEIGQKMNRVRAGQGAEAGYGVVPAAATLPAVPGEYAGIATNTYDKKPPTPTRTQLALHRLVDAPADQLDAKANKELETARELWDSRHDWDAQIPVGMGISLPLGHAIALSQSVSGAADKVLSKIPMLGPLVNSIAEKFENGDVSGGLTDIALLKAAEHVHGKITGEESAVPSRIFTDKGHELGKGAKAAFDSFKAATTDKLKPAVSDAANAAREDFKTAAPPSKAAPYDDNDYEIVRRTAEENHKADKLAGGEGISGIETARDIVEDGRHAIEAKRSGAVQKFADKPITTNVFEDVANELAEKDKTTPGFRDEGMKVLDEHNFKDLTNKEADAIRKTLVAKNRLMEKNPWDAASLRESNPEYAARETVIDSLRKGIYGSLQEAGVPEAYDWARDEAAHIRVRKALDRQIFNAEKTVRGSADVGPARKIAAQVAKAGSAVAGTGLGAAVGGVPGAIIGGAVGTVAGEGISRAILPSDMTRNELMARSFAPEQQLATPEGPTVPPSQATEVPYPQGPAGPDLPPPPQPIPPAMPPPDHALHAALATRIGTTVERSNFDNLMSKFQEYLDNTPANKLTEGDRDLLQQLNESQAERKNKVTEAVQKAYDQNKAAREKWQAEVKKIQEKHVAEQEAEKIKAIEDAKTGETPSDVNPTLDAAGRGDESGLVSHSPAMKAHSNIGMIEGPEGLSPEQILRHEWAHIAMDAVDGEPTGHEIRSDSHPKVTPGSSASAVFDASAIKDPEGNIDPEALKGQLTKWLTQKMSGPASHEVFDGMTKDEAMSHPGTRVDVRQARSIVREVHPEFSPSQVEEVVDGAYERARDFISQPHIGDRIKANAAVREDGLSETLHASRGRVSQFQKDILEAHNEFEGTTNPEPSGGGTGEGGEKAAQPATKAGKEKNAGGSKERGEGESLKPAGKSEAASGVAESQVTRPETPEAKKLLDKAEELRTQLLKTKEAGKQRILGAKIKDLELQAANAMSESQVTKAGDITSADESTGGTSDRLVKKYGESKDPLSTGFILSDGRRVDFGADDHAAAVRKATPVNERSPNETEDLKDFINRENAIRTRYRDTKAGKEVVFSVPKNGVNEEQISQMRQAVGKMGRYGNAVMEIAEGEGKSTQKEFARPSDVDSMLREIGAHPDQSGAEPNDWVKKAEATKGEGFSFHPGTGEAPKDGYMVETHLDRGQQYDHPPTAGDIRTFTEKNKDILGKNPDLYVGGYKNTLGISERLADQAAAEELGKKTNQISIYDVAGGKEIPTGGTGEVKSEDLEQSNVAKSPEGSSDARELAQFDEQFVAVPKGESSPSGVEAHRGFLLNDGSILAARAIHGEKGPFSTEITTHEDLVNHFGRDAIKSKNAIRIADSNMFELYGKPSDVQLSEMARLAKESGENKIIWDLYDGANDPKEGEENSLEHLRGNFIDSGNGSVGAFKRAVDKAYLDNLEQSNIAKSPKGSSVPLMDNPLPVKGTMEGGDVGTLDLTKALNAFSRKSNPALEPGSEPKEMVARAQKLAEDEAKYQLAQSKTGTEWYTTEMKDHDKVLQDLRPELAGGETTEGVEGHPVKLTLFKAAEAILSSGQKPYANVKSALRAWDAYNETGQFPRSNPMAGKEGMSWGPRNVNAYGSAIDSLNKLIQEKGEKGTADWLLGEHPVKELRQYMTSGQSPVSGKATDLVPGAMILGEKRGPFMHNLHGIESKFTADMWVSRTWNRWMGTLDLDPRIEDKGKMTSESDSPRNNAERSMMKESFEKTAGKLGLTTSSLQAVLWYYEQALYRAHGLPVESWSFSDAAKRVAAEAKAAPEAEQTGFNFGENAKKQGVMEGLTGRTPQVEGRVPAFDFLNSLKRNPLTTAPVSGTVK